LIAFDEDLILPADAMWKKATWQKMLIGEYLQKKGLAVASVCYLDTDILINPTAPNITIAWNLFLSSCTLAEFQLNESAQRSMY